MKHSNNEGHDEPKGQAPKKPALRYPDHAFRPEDLLDFIELPQFTRRWAELGLNDESDLIALQLFIMAEPKRGKVIKGTRGLRKIRFAPHRWKTGKSGAARILYVHFEEYGWVLLCLVFRKNEIEDISKPVKDHLNKRIDEVEVELRRKYGGH